MTIVEGQVETLKKLKHSLAELGLSEFESIGQINNFLQNYNAEIRDLPSRVNRELETETADIKASYVTLKSTLNELLEELNSKHNLQLLALEQKKRLLSGRKAKNFLARVGLDLVIIFYSYKSRHLAAGFKKTLHRRTRDTRKKLKEIQNDLIIIPSKKTSVIQICQLTLGHILCDYIEKNL